MKAMHCVQKHVRAFRGTLNEKEYVQMAVKVSQIIDRQDLGLQSPGVGSAHRADKCRGVRSQCFAAPGIRRIDDSNHDGSFLRKRLEKAKSSHRCLQIIDGRPINSMCGWQDSE